ncbi:MAG TPA: hydrogenase accessory protein HypB [Syntrophaceae bacterium]|jgi:hydrogenase nickel incorporation protein HypB|nr:hydrogenase accessory protein HypB [Syntrophaceae bacterium]
MADIRLIEIKEDILSDNKNLADEIRDMLRIHNVFMLNLMSSPGSGKTSLIVNTIRSMQDTRRIGVIEGDIDSTVDAEKVVQEGIPAVQLKTGGFCHLDAAMIKMALDEMDLENLDLVIIENIGNLVCPAEFDTGAQKNAMILSVPEGDDKPLKYPLIFNVCDVLVVNKIDYMGIADFDMAALKERALKLNPNITIIEASCKTGEGIEKWTSWLTEEMNAYQRAVT